jgi:hypothetical protein
VFMVIPSMTGFDNLWHGGLIPVLSSSMSR